ncbi:MAG: TolC family protein [Bacteroidetes bacterium HGW-Bacteroidetes-2]|jgi:outer membrane protein TolC|nr:MAG: TolC family protein [Bacteroidetes bacterium HGW-Bacteroidetes-2]
MKESLIKYFQKRFSGIKFILLLLPFCGLGGYSQTLDDYLQTAVENNPKLKSSYAQFEAAMQQAPQVSSLSDPTLTMSAFGRMIETRIGTQEARVSLTQMFPWFGTLQAKKDASVLMAEAKFQNYLDLRNQLFFEIKSVYAELYAIEKTIQLKKENLSILNSYHELSLTRFKSGNAPMVNVIKVDIKREAAITEIELLEKIKKPLETRFNLMLNRETEIAVQIQDTLIFNKDEILVNPKEIFEKHPSITGLEKQKKSYEMQQIVAQKEGLPMFGLGIDYSVISKRTDANPDKNGQDAIMPMLTVTLPIFRNKYRAAKKEAEFMASSIKQQQEAQKNELQSTYEMTLYDLKKAEQLIALYQKQLVSSGHASKLLISGFSNSIIDFEEVLQMNQDILMLQTQEIEAIKSGFMAKAKMDYLISK